MCIFLSLSFRLKRNIKALWNLALHYYNKLITTNDIKILNYNNRENL